MCAINFDNFRTDSRELLSGKHKTPTQKGKKNKEHISSISSYQQVSWAEQENFWGQFYKTEYKNALKYLPIMIGLLSVEGHA